MTAVSIGEYVTFSGNNGVQLYKGALELDSSELKRIVTLAFGHSDDQVLRDAGCGAQGLLFERADGRYTVPYEEYLEILREAQVTEATRRAKKDLTKIRRSQFNAARSDIMLALIEIGRTYRCEKCDETEDLTIDHIVSLSRGGSDALENLRFLCRLCNSIKGA